MSKTPTVQDWARIKRAGYRVERFGGPPAKPTGWVLRDSEGAYLMIGDHGQVAPSQYEAVAEALRRIEQDERLAAAAEPRRCPDCGHDLMNPEPEGQPGDDSFYCEGCGSAWALTLTRKVL